MFFVKNLGVMEREVSNILLNGSVKSSYFNLYLTNILYIWERSNILKIIYWEVIYS